jgi:two-component system chemotaxis response regulator CheB
VAVNMSARKIRVLIVEDSPTMQQMLVRILAKDPGIEVVGVAGDGREAIDLLPLQKPDLVTVDVNMPKMDGFEVTRRIMETQPVPVVIVSASWAPQEVATTFTALEAGALAVVSKPRGFGHPEHDQEARKLLETVKAMAEVKVVKRWSRARRVEPVSVAPPVKEAKVPAAGVQLVAIGASTGGPIALQTILAGLPKPFPVPILVVQHIAVGFLEGLMEWLGGTTGLQVCIAEHGQSVLPNHVYLAPDDIHMGVNKRSQVVLSRTDANDGLRPSVAHLFASVTDSFGDRAAGVLLTGMGRDGAAGLKRMHDAGALTIAQDQESSIVFGMPGEAVRLGATDYVLNPEKIAALLASVVRST